MVGRAPAAQNSKGPEARYCLRAAGCRKTYAGALRHADYDDAYGGNDAGADAGPARHGGRQTDSLVQMHPHRYLVSTCLMGLLIAYYIGRTGAVN